MPQNIGAVAVFALGWLVAVSARAAIHRLLGMLGVPGANRRIGERTAARIDAGRAGGAGGVLAGDHGRGGHGAERAGPSSLFNPFSHMLTDLPPCLRHLVAGLMLTLRASPLATVTRAGASELLAATAVDEKLSEAAGQLMQHGLSRWRRDGRWAPTADR